jgi:hypothetical protein
MKKEYPGAVNTGARGRCTSGEIKRTSAPPQAPCAPVYVLRLQSPRGDDVRRLRLLLKLLVRRYELRCLSVEEEAQL